MKTIQMTIMMLLAVALGVAPAFAVTFDSGTTCTSTSDAGGHDKCLGAFSPVVNTVVPLPADGILDYSTYYIPAGVTVTFTKNAANTPVTIRTFGNVTIEGTINVSAGVNGSNATNSGTYGDGNLGDDGQPGTGGPGGFDGGQGGLAALYGGVSYLAGGSGKGPGGGRSISATNTCNYGSAAVANGGGGGFNGNGGDPWCIGSMGGASYGQLTLLPLIGGSGGGGGTSGSVYNGSGGGGGGGAILIAAGTASNPATITVGKSNGYGYIYADGGTGGGSAGSGCGGAGGGGSGGAIRLVANTLANPGPGYGLLYARGGGVLNGCYSGAGGGAAGFIRLESNVITGWNTGMSNPVYTFGQPGHVLVPNNPTLTIVSVTPTSGSQNGVTAASPATPTGNADITFPTGTTTATVNLSGYYIPTGSTATVNVIPASGAVRSSALSTAFSGSSTGTTTATATVTLSPGNNVLQAVVTYTVTEAVAMNLPQFNGEYVAKIRVEGGMNGESKVTYITASGKEYPASKAKV